MLNLSQCKGTEASEGKIHLSKDYDCNTKNMVDFWIILVISLSDDGIVKILKYIRVSNRTIIFIENVTVRAPSSIHDKIHQVLASMHILCPDHHIFRIKKTLKSLFSYLQKC